jgi:hypothetical protein
MPVEYGRGKVKLGEGKFNDPVPSITSYRSTRLTRGD